MTKVEKLLKNVLALSLCVCAIAAMSVSASAAEMRVAGFGGYAGRTVRVVSYSDPTQELNVLTSSGVSNNKNVTTWPVSQADEYHNFVVYHEGDTKYSFRVSKSPNYAVELYYGSSNMNNCDIYDTTAGIKYIKPEDYQFSASTLNSYYRFYIAKNNYALTTGSNMTIAGTSIKDVRWAPGSLNDNNQCWTITVIK